MLPQGTAKIPAELLQALLRVILRALFRFGTRRAVVFTKELVNMLQFAALDNDVVLPALLQMCLRSATRGLLVQFAEETLLAAINRHPFLDEVMATKVASWRAAASQTSGQLDLSSEQQLSIARHRMQQLLLLLLEPSMEFLRAHLSKQFWILSGFTLPDETLRHRLCSVYCAALSMSAAQTTNVLDKVCPKFPSSSAPVSVVSSSRLHRVSL